MENILICNDCLKFLSKDDLNRYIIESIQLKKKIYCFHERLTMNQEPVD